MWWKTILEWFEGGAAKQKISIEIVPEIPPEACANSDGSFSMNKYDLFNSLAKARQEALEPKLPDSLKEFVTAGVYNTLPILFKKALIGNEELFLMAKSDVSSSRLDDDDWMIVKSFIMKELSDNGIKNRNSSDGKYIAFQTKDLLDLIKNYKPVEEKEDPVMNSIGVYR